MKTRIVELSSGYEVEVRPVPPTVYLDLELQYSRDNPPPQKPTVKVKSVAGHTEELLAAMNSPEWVEYERQKALYDQGLQAYKINFSYNYGVIRWRQVRIADKEFPPEALLWVNEPFDDWQPDPLCPDKTSPRRILFVKYELIANLDDDRAISNPFPVAAITEQEVEAAIAKFRPETEREPVAPGPVKRKGSNK